MRAGGSLRSVARQFGVSLQTVQRWTERARDLPLELVDWTERSRRPQHVPRETDASVQERVLALRKSLATESALGEYGAAAIRRTLEESGQPNVPSVRTVHRILERHGALDGKRRVRRPAPPPGWYVPAVASGCAELDQFDAIVDLVIEGGQGVEVLNAVSLHGGLVASWPSAAVTSETVRDALPEHWRTWGLPGYAQFDNDTRFQGPHQHADVIGTVARLCLSLGVTPVYAPPRETGFQAMVESLNNQWQQKVWHRFHHEDLPALRRQSEQYIAAVHRRRAVRLEGAPLRPRVPRDWQADLRRCPSGRIIYIRRTDEHGQIALLGHQFSVSQHWCHRLVRVELDLVLDELHFYGLRRAEPSAQPLLNSVAYSGFRRHFVR